MFLSRSDFLLQFSQRVLDSKTALFLGAGGTIDAGYPSWKELYMPIAKELGKTIDDIDRMVIVFNYNNSSIHSYRQ